MGQLGNNERLILDWVERRIRDSDEFYLPLKKIWQELSREKTIVLPSLDMLGDLVKKDSRFDFFELPKEQVERESEQERARLEALGFYSGPRVGLKTKKPTREQMVQMIKQNTQKMLEALQKAYEVRPRGSAEAEEQEDRLLEIMRKAKKLKDELDRIFREDLK